MPNIVHIMVVFMLLLELDKVVQCIYTSAYVCYQEDMSTSTRNQMPQFMQKSIFRPLWASYQYKPNPQINTYIYMFR